MSSETIAELVGVTLIRVEGCMVGSNEMDFITTDNRRFRFWHAQDCCEHVEIADVTGDPSDLVGSPLTLADVVTSGELFNGEPKDPESFQWTFYKFATVNGYVDVRWLGESNGYYSEAVDFGLVTPREK